MESTEIQQHEIAEIEEFADKRDTMISEIRKVIVGQDRVIEEVLIALFAKGRGAAKSGSGGGITITPGTGTPWRKSSTWSSTEFNLRRT
jgi:hypothetical protein